VIKKSGTEITETLFIQEELLKGIEITCFKNRSRNICRFSIVAIQTTEIMAIQLNFSNIMTSFRNILLEP
jgi:hypothetical protein